MEVLNWDLSLDLAVEEVSLSSQYSVFFESEISVQIDGLLNSIDSPRFKSPAEILRADEVKKMVVVLENSSRFLRR